MSLTSPTSLIYVVLPIPSSKITGYYLKFLSSHTLSSLLFSNHSIIRRATDVIIEKIINKIIQINIYVLT
jgi:hypothetical protein